MTEIKTLEQAARQALEAWDDTVLPKANDGLMQECMEKMRSALEQPQQEPVAWLYDWIAYGHEGETVIRDWISADYDEAHSPTSGCHNIRPLYTSPPAPRRPLTDEEIEEINVSLAGRRDLARMFARAIEARILGSKT